MENNKVAATAAALWITVASVSGQDNLLNAIVKALGEVETGNIKDSGRRASYRRGQCAGWYQMSEDLWYDTTLYRFKQGKRLYLYHHVTDPFCARVYCYSALELLCTRWYDIFGYYPTVRDLANCYREGLSATIQGRIRKGNYAQRVENLTQKYMENQ